MKRYIITQLINWKKENKRKTLLLQGARQTGKTYILKAFGKKYFKNTHYFDFMSNPELGKIFEKNYNTDRIILELEFFLNKKIEIEKDLIIFDEIQESSFALTSLKYFTENYTNSYLCASGSFLGLSLSNSSFPVGKIITKVLYPMSFNEFLIAMDEKIALGILDKFQISLKDSNNIISHKNNEDIISEFIHQKIWELYKYYMITGGMPEVVKLFKDSNKKHLNETFKNIRVLQKELFNNYLDDISKHSGKIKSIKIQAVLKNIPIQLAREDKTVNKFIFKDILNSNSRYSELEAPIEWLVKAGLVLKVPICNNAISPLKAYADKKRFKLYIFDIGILGAMLELSPKKIYDYNYGSYKGYFAENIVLQELTTKYGKQFYSWQKNTSEIEFLTEIEDEIVPVEVKAGINTKAKSLSVFKKTYLPKRTILLSANPFEDKYPTRFPLYLADKLW